MVIQLIPSCGKMTFKIFCNGIPHTGSKIHLRGMNHDIGVNKAVDSRTFEEVKTVKPPVFSVHDGECRHGGTVGRYRRKSKDRYPQLICGSLCRIHRLAAAHSKYHINRFIFIETAQFTDSFISTFCSVYGRIHNFQSAVRRFQGLAKDRKPF